MRTMLDIDRLLCTGLSSTSTILDPTMPWHHIRIRTCHEVFTDSIRGRDADDALRNAIWNWVTASPAPADKVEYLGLDTDNDELENGADGATRRHELAQRNEKAWFDWLAKPAHPADRSQALRGLAAAHDEMAATYALIPWAAGGPSDQDQIDMAAGYGHNARLLRMLAATEVAAATTGVWTSRGDPFEHVPGVTAVLNDLVIDSDRRRRGVLIEQLVTVLTDHLAGQAADDLAVLAGTYRS